MGEDPSASFQKILQQNATSPSIGGKTDAISVFNLNTNFFRINGYWLFKN